MFQICLHTCSHDDPQRFQSTGLTFNLHFSHKVACHHHNWQSLFLAVIWCIWKARNVEIFQNHQFCSFTVLRQARMLATNMLLRADTFGVLSLDPVNGRWEKPPPGYVKLNTDGSFRDGGLAYGGLLRDEYGDWLWVYAGKAAGTDALAAELHALLRKTIALSKRNFRRFGSRGF